MKKIFTILILALIFSCAQSNKTESSYNMDELIFVVEMDSNEGKTIEEITQFLNTVLEQMIVKNPLQWIWTHDRWKK